MTHGIRKSLEDVTSELRGIKNILNSIWSTQYKKEGVPVTDPGAFTDEYISTEECAKRLSVSDQTIRNWIAVGKKFSDKGWKEGLHYVNIGFEQGKRATIRIPWNNLVQSFSKNKEITLVDFSKHKNLYQRESLSDQIDQEHVTSF
jgi:hypothetical protein